VGFRGTVNLRFLHVHEGVREDTSSMPLSVRGKRTHASKEHDSHEVWFFLFDTSLAHVEMVMLVGL
jgi:hypothetical protein